MSAPSQADLEAAHCWEASDRVPGRPEMTEFRRRTRLAQARWREAHGHPIGTEPVDPPRTGKRARLLGSRLPLEYARETGANFVTPAARTAAAARSELVEPNQTFDRQRLWADLLSSMALSFNLLGDLAADLALADRAVHTWWPDVPGTVTAIRFQHSPGGLDLSYIGSLVTLDAAVMLDLGDGTRGVLGIDVKLHERTRRELPKPERLPRYLPNP